MMFAMVYLPRVWPVFGAAWPTGPSGFELVAWFHWLWVGWIFTGAWRVGASVRAARIAFGIGLVAWLAACFPMAFLTLMALGAHT